MSRSLTAAIASATRSRVAVGWDPAGSFFAVLVATPKDVLNEETPVKTLCGDMDEISTVDGLRSLLAAHDIALPDDIATLLAIDQNRAAKRPLMHAWNTVNGERIPVWRSS